MARLRNVLVVGLLSLVGLGSVGSFAGCTQQGTLLEVPASATTATSYEVFWFNETNSGKANGAPCVGFDGPGPLKAMYVDRIIDDATAQGPQPLPNDFAKNGLTILVTGTNSARVAVALLNGDQVVGIADSLTPVNVSDTTLRRYPLATTVTTNATEYRPGFKDVLGTHASVLRFAPNDSVVEFRITSEGSMDFDGDRFPVAFDNQCPLVNGRFNKDADCDDLNAARFPQDNVDTTCGAATDLDCKFNKVAATACTVLVEPPTPAKACKLGLQNCSDNESGQCEILPAAPEVNLGANYCTQSAVRKWKCTVTAGPTCVGDPVATTFLPQNPASQGCSVWYSPVGTAPTSNTIGVFKDITALMPLAPGQDTALTQCAVHLSATALSSTISPIWLTANRTEPSAVVNFLSFVLQPCAVGASAGITCVPN